MSAKGQKRTLERGFGMSALPPKADMPSSGIGRLFGENGLLVVLHIHDDPAALWGILKGLYQLATAFGMIVVGVLASGIGTMDDYAKTRSRVLNRGVFQHRLVARTDAPSPGRCSPAMPSLSAAT